MIFCRCGHGLSNELRTLQTCLGKICLLDYFSEHCWQWLYCIGIIYRLDIINHVKNIGTSVIRTFRIIEVALYSSTQDMMRMLIIYSVGTVVASLLFLVCGLSLMLVWITLTPKLLIESAKYLEGWRVWIPFSMYSNLPTASLSCVCVCVCMCVCVCVCVRACVWSFILADSIYLRSSISKSSIFQEPHIHVHIHVHVHIHIQHVHVADMYTTYTSIIHYLARACSYNLCKLYVWHIVYL